MDKRFFAQGLFVGSSKRRLRVKKGWILFATLIFFILNALKVVLFNLHIIPPAGVGKFFPIIKYATTLFWVVIIFLLIFKTKRPYVFIAFYSIQAAYILANLLYYAYFGNYLHIFHSLRLIREGMEAAGHMPVLGNPHLLITIIDLPVFVYILTLYPQVRLLNVRMRLCRRTVIACCVTALLLFEAQQIISGNTIFLYLFKKHAGETPIVANYGTLANNLAHVFKHGGEKAAIKGIRYGEPMMRAEESPQKFNFIIIQVEAMDSNIVNAKHKDKYVIPFLNSLANRSIYYPYTLSYHKGGGASDCEIAVINSFEPPGDFPMVKTVGYDYPNSLVRRLLPYSYETIAFHGNRGSYFNRDIAFRKMGFGEFEDIFGMELNVKDWGAEDRDVFGHVAARLENRREPFLYYIITMSSHLRYMLVRNHYNNNHYDDIADEDVRNHFNSMSYVDLVLEEFISAVEPMLDNTYIFIFGDHSPGIDKETYRQATLFADDRYFEFVPLFIITPEGKKYAETEKAASFLDIAPTILYASGVPFEMMTNGRNLLAVPVPDVLLPFEGKNYSSKYLHEMISSRK